MKPIISISTGIFYHLSFERALNIIKSSGFDYVEIAGYWIDGDWEVGQNLKNYSFDDIIKAVNKYNLKISSFHDMSGSLYSTNSSVVTKYTKEIINKYEIPYIVTHFPYILEKDKNKFESFKKMSIEQYIKLSKNSLIFVENMANINGYINLFYTPKEMLEFCNLTKTYINLDIIHLCEENFDIEKTISLLKDKIMSLHISGYSKQYGRTDFNNSDLNIKKILSLLDLNKIISITIETKIDQSINDDIKYIKICRNIKNELERMLKDIRMYEK